MPNFITYFVLWGVLALAVLAIALYRRSLSSREDDSIHLSAGENAAVSEQTTLARQLAIVDRWGKLLTIVLVVTGLVLGGLYLWSVWTDQARMIGQ